MTDLTDVHGKSLMSFVPRKFSGNLQYHMTSIKLLECIHGVRILLSRVGLYFNPGQTSPEFLVFKRVQHKNRMTLSCGKLLQEFQEP